MKEPSAIRCALICTDDGLRATVTDVLRRPERGISLAFEFAAPFTNLGDVQLRELRNLDPELVILDIDADPVLGIKFAQFLSNQSPRRRILAIGPMLPSEQLLAVLRAGISEYLPKPVTKEGLTAALEGMARKLRWSPTASPGQPGKLYAVFSAKGASGSTTVATNLAIHLHQLTGRRVLLVDLDLELGEIALQLGVEPRFNFIDMVWNFHRMDSELLTSFIENHSSGVHLLSAPYHPERTAEVTGDQISKILQFLKQHYDYVIVDTSKSFSPPTLATFEQADQIYLLTTVELPSLRNIARCLPLLKEVAAPADDRIRLVLNRYREDSVLRKEDVERTLDMKVYWTIGNDYEEVINSINSGTPIILNGTSRSAQDLKALGAEIAGLTVSSARKRRRGVGVLLEPFGRMWRRTFFGQPEVQV